MRSYIAALIAASVCSLQVHALAYHVHRAPDRIRGDRHTHAPAIHHHPSHHDDAAGDLQVSAADGTVDAITLSVPAATPSDALAMDALPAEVLSFEEPELTARMPAVELHSHGPPLARNSLFRGPPTSTHS